MTIRPFSHWGAGLLLALGLVATSTQGAHAAQPTPPPQPAITPFTGTATLSYVDTELSIPSAGRRDIAKHQETIDFAVRDATHWRVDMHTTAPILQSGDQIYVSDGTQIVSYDSVTNAAYRLPGGVTESPPLLSILLRSSGIPIGTSTADFISLARRAPRVKVQQTGQDQVAGQTADVLKLSPIVWESSGSCTGAKSCASKEKGYGSATTWLDHAHGVVLRYEQHGMPKNSGGERSYKYLVTAITYGTGPSDTDLAYTPPAPIVPQPTGGNSSSGGSGSGGGTFWAPPGFVSVGDPVIGGSALALRGNGSGGDSTGDVTYAQGIFQGMPSQGFVYVEERLRPTGLPAALTSGTSQTAGSCTAWTGAFPDGVNWLAMQRKHIAILVVANKATQAQLVHYAASGICKAKITPPPTAAELRDTALEHLETEIDITRQILSVAIAAAPAKDVSTLKSYDRRLIAFDRTVFAIRNGSKAAYSPPDVSTSDRTTFKDAVGSLKGELGALTYQLSAAEAAVSPSDRQKLVKASKVVNQLINAVDGMVSG